MGTARKEGRKVRAGWGSVSGVLPRIQEASHVSKHNRKITLQPLMAKVHRKQKKCLNLTSPEKKAPNAAI